MIRTEALAQSEETGRRAGCVGYPLPGSEQVERLVARRFRVPLGVLHAASRCDRNAALARHVAMYLERVLLERPHQEIARRFRRHPSTVTYACRRIEALRDNAAFERRIGALEDALLTGTREQAQ